MKWTLQDPGEWFEESSPSLIISEERIEAQTAVSAAMLYFATSRAFR